MKLEDVSGSTTSYSHEKLKKATFYKYQVAAYQVINGKKVIIAKSTLIHSITTSKTYGNPTKVIANTKATTLLVGGFKKIGCKAVSTKGLNVPQHTAAICFKSTNNDIVEISSNGTITAKSKGSCDIYVYAQNGVYTKVEVTVN